MLHSSIVGGSTAKRVMACPASVGLAAKMPPQPSSSYANEGTLLHEAAAALLTDDALDIPDVVGMTVNGVTLTPELMDEKLRPAFELLNALDPQQQMQIAVEVKVSFGDLLSGVFGSCDIIGRINESVYIIDWKFGDGVPVEAEENPQLLFYAAAAMRTPGLEWVFDGAKDIMLVIIQPPGIKTWTTSFDRVRFFERELVHAVKLAQHPLPPLHAGEHCRFCPAKAICPELTGQARRALHEKLDVIGPQHAGEMLAMADRLEEWIAAVRGLALQRLEAGKPVDGYKLVAKRGTRKWVDENAAVETLSRVIAREELYESSVLSPAQVEKKLKKLKQKLPENLVVSISSGNTLASLDDPRPEVLTIGASISEALKAIQ
jgi:hypothetical protein